MSARTRTYHTLALQDQNGPLSPPRLPPSSCIKGPSVPEMRSEGRWTHSHGRRAGALRGPTSLAPHAGWSAGSRGAASRLCDEPRGRCFKFMGRGVCVTVPGLCAYAAKAGVDVSGCGHVPIKLYENRWWSPFADLGLEGTWGRGKLSTCILVRQESPGPAPPGAPGCGGGQYLKRAKA